jgi:hypothetical protein
MSQKLADRILQPIFTALALYEKQEALEKRVAKEKQDLIKAIADVVTEIDYGDMAAYEVRDRAVEIINSFAQDKKEG